MEPLHLWDYFYWGKNLKLKLDPHKTRMIFIVFNGCCKIWFNKNEVLGNPHSPPPPSLMSTEFKKDIDSVKAIGNTRTSEQKRITEFWANCISTFTSTGHWNKIAEILIRKDHFTECGGSF